MTADRMVDHTQGFRRAARGLGALVPPVDVVLSSPYSRAWSPRCSSSTRPTSPRRTVSTPWRATGIGSRLSERLEQITRTAGDSHMVVSATPSEDTVRFYLGRGFQPMADPFELEPEDVHMCKML